MSFIISDVCNSLFFIPCPNKLLYIRYPVISSRILNLIFFFAHFCILHVEWISCLMNTIMLQFSFLFWWILYYAVGLDQFVLLLFAVSGTEFGSSYSDTLFPAWSMTQISMKIGILLFQVGYLNVRRFAICISLDVYGW